MSVYLIIGLGSAVSFGKGGPRNGGMGTPSGRSIAASGSVSLCSFVAEISCLRKRQKRQLLLEEKVTYQIRI